ncbi:MAG: ATP-binding cassette domain-containing protein [Limimaricola sp.]|uniref:ABC transporter ATP-binding protein n=1 Tax=Limimaricola sp. TaxID=2211665 RepID=UPI001DC1EF60|nr:ABC transporter ATP-binding protein [Limimaricola sp.]MBI1417199.1 ATP-binding cassette domain-containing protein [Limimaricola sp.]
MKIDNLIDPLSPAEGAPPRSFFPFLRWSLRGSFGVTLAGGLVSTLAGVSEVLAALILGRVIDAALGAPPDQFFSANMALLLAVVGFFILFRPAILGLSGLMQSVIIAPSVFNLVLSRLHRYTLGQAVTFFDNDFAGRIAQKQMQAARAITDLSVDMIQTVFFALASLVASVGLLATIDGWSALVLAFWVLAYMTLIRVYMPTIRATSKDRAASRAVVTGQVVDTITNIKTVKLFAHAEHEDKAAIRAMSRFRDDSLSFGWASAGFRFWLMALAGILPVLLVGATLWFWSRGQATAGDIAASGQISLRLAQMTGWVSFTLMTMYSNVGEVEDAIHTLTPPYQLADRPGAVDIRPAREIRYDHVTFTYGRESGGIRDVDLTIHAGEKVGLVGASGAGKSTLVALLLRLYDAEEGAVLVGGQDVREVTQESLRRQIGMVTQETAMFNRSAMDNIRYGRPDATDEEVFEAARKAEAHEFILELRDHKGRNGYAAHLGERGVKLSGGQRQRIALARAMLKDAPILILDEATSALDSEVEASIQAALEVAMEGKTVLAIAHRLSTISSMDRIIVLDQGRIVEQGNHSDLLSRGGLYARYWGLQSGGFMNIPAVAE